MAATFPLTVDPSTPNGDTESARNLSDRINEVKKQYDAIFGIPESPTAMTAAYSSMAAGGLSTILQNIQWEAGGTQLGVLTHSNTATRTYTFPDRSLTIGGTDDVGTLTNSTGGALAAGNVVVPGTAASSVVLGDTQGALEPMLVSLDAPASTATGRFQGRGVATVSVTGAVTIGRWLRKSATTLVLEDTGIAIAAATPPPAGACAVALTSAAGPGAGTVTALLCGWTARGDVPSPGTSILSFTNTTTITLGLGVVPLKVGGQWISRAITTALTIANTGLAATTLYYVYVFDSSGTSTLEISTTGHSTDSTFGVETKTGDATRTLVGMIYTGAGNPGVFVGGLQTLSFFNRRSKSATTTFSVDRTTTSSSYVELNTEIRNTFLTWGDEAVGMTVNGSVQDSAGNLRYAASAVALDGTTAEAGFETVSLFSANVANGIDAVSIAGWKSGASEGNHYATLLGASNDNASTCTWFSSTDTTAGKAKVRLHVTVRG